MVDDLWVHVDIPDGVLDVLDIEILHAKEMATDAVSNDNCQTQDF